MTQLNVAAVQYCASADATANFDCIEALVGEAARSGAQLVLLPENALFMGVHERDKLDLAEPLDDGPWQQALAALAARCGVHLVVGSFPLQVEADTQHVWPSTLVFDPAGQRVARYDKLHLFDVALDNGKVYQESRYFRRGDNAPQSFECHGVRVGLSICYDLRFPELYRQLVAEGAELLLVPAAFTHATGQEHWEVLLRARAIENLAGVVAANQCGTHPSGQRSWGHSMIVDPWGRVLASCDEQPGLCQAVIDLDALARRRREFPVLQHRSL